MSHRNGNIPTSVILKPVGVHIVKYKKTLPKLGQKRIHARRPMPVIPDKQ